MASPFELLLNVCNQERIALDAEKRASQEAKKASRKRHASSEPLSFKEIRALSAKSLVERYAKFTSDEMSKKYSYQCRLLPFKCYETYKSYGNEKKALEKMKLHLKSHLKDRPSEIDVSLFAKSPSEEEKLTWSNDLQKSPKKPKVEPQPSSSSDNQVNYEPPRSVRRVDSCPAKKMLEFTNGVAHKPTSKRKKYTPKPKSKIEKRTLPVVDFKSLEYPPYDDEDRNEPPKPSICSSESEDSRDSMASSSSSVNYMNNDWSTGVPSPEVTQNYTVYLPDHDYAAVCGVDSLPVSEDESEAFIPPKKKRRKYQKQFIIPTPKFPYLHDPSEFEVIEIAEVDEFCNRVKPKQHTGISCLDIDRYISHMETAEKKNPGVEQKPFFFPKYETCDVTGSVLECVENKFKAKTSSCCASKFKCYPSTSNDENSENVQKIRKELALKHISQLNSKRKKQYQGPLQCQLCLDGRQFTAVASLMHHYRSHAGIKLFVCNICNDTFTRQHSLNYHMMIHQNQSRFCCEFCQRNFRHPSHFKEHLRRHTGETPFQCSFCNMLFKTRNTFKRHLRMQHKKILTAHGIEDDKGEGPSRKKKQHATNQHQ
ncbi:hypothetical protein JTE90_007105 [Oedothorax gibbosus]|uniref:C2H2-type domain-containing protein n=1 Tax=Oedothorax gibbosus TaxID=931172 RepID=A0AAV6VRW1_9ARAC|nr:hypothetical protein JTE90_007105 [Oedothorax gibbosus]